MEFIKIPDLESDTRELQFIAQDHEHPRQFLAIKI
jgi:hypothetical protein